MNLIEFLRKNLNFLIILSVIATCLLLFAFFPATNFFQNLTKEFFFLLLVPFLFVKYFLRKNITEFGFNLKNKKIGFLWSLLALFFSFLFIYLLSNFTSFGKNYHLPKSVSENFYFFLFYELILVNFLFFFQEYFFKGFLLSILREKTDYLSVPIQAIIYLIPLWIFTNSIWQTIPLTILSLVGGIVAYRTKSFFYSYLFGIVFLLMTDAYIIFLNK